MGDSSMMTIEFLRARLLSERSVSKAAKERSDQLAKRVMELEEQLNVVTYERKKVEKAALEAFSLLRSHGIDDFYEEVGSSSDKDESHSENECNGTQQEDKTSKFAEKKEPEFEDALSSSGPGFPTSQGGSLSWKSRGHSRDSEKKLNVRQIRQRMRRISLMSSMNSSPKYNLGKSCRKIRRRETGSTTEDEGDNGFILDDHRKTDAVRSDCTDDQLNLSVEATGNEPCYENTQREQYDPSLSSFGIGRDEEMERVLEQHANLIGRYEAEEKAQREWEEKYNENKISVLDPVDVEDCSSLAEHTAEPIDELTAIVLYEDKDAKSSSGISSINRELTTGVPLDELTAIVPYDEKEAKSSSRVPYSNKELTTGVLSNEPERLDGFNSALSVRRQDEPMNLSDTLAVTHQTRTIQESISEASRSAMRNQVNNNRKSIEGGPFELALSAEGSTTSSPTAIQNQDLESESSSSSSFNMHSNAPRIMTSPIGVSPLIATSQEDGPKQDPNFKQSQKASGSLQSVLGALQRAKLSLRQELHKVPSVSQGTWALTTVPNYDARTSTPDKIIEVPFGSAGLFRLPTDTFPQAQKPKYGTGSSLISSYPRLGYNDSIVDGSATSAYSKYGSGNFMTKYFESYRPDISLPTLDRIPEPYSDLPTDRTFPYKSGISQGNQHFRFGTSYEDTATRVSSNRFPVDTDVTREASAFSTGFMNSKLNQHADNCHFGSKEPACDVYPRMYSELPRERRLHDELPKHQNDWISGMSSADRYSLYSGHGIQSKWRTS